MPTPARSISSQLGGTKGARIGPFVLEELAGSGPYAEVWHARHAYLEGPRATLKLFTHPLTRQLLSHGPSVRWLDGNRYLPATFDFRPDHDPPYHATAHVAGRNLRQVLSLGPLEIKRALALLAQLIAALKHAHQHGVLHLDLKSENILVGEQDQLTLLDLPVGRFSAETSRLLRDASSASITSSVSRGLRYRSREQMKGEGVDARADVYGFGLLLFEMLTGDLPAGAQLPSQVVPTVPRKFDQIFSRCCAVLEKRYESMLAVEQELRGGKHTAESGSFSAAGVVAATSVAPAADGASSPQPTAPGAAAITPHADARRKLGEELPATAIEGERLAVLDMSEICGARAFDIQAIPRVAELFERIQAAGLDRLAIDFGRIDYIASNGFGFLVNLADQLRAAGGAAALFAVQPKVATIMEVMGLKGFFTLCPDRPAAVAAVR